ncbi:MAG: hypothetical protein CVU03_02240 [Bacteroidetes bacterium HGW-Bacteroidetes-2]|jgi:hypothetical protein|nr:MAG: hypothetical protein CVU13_06075 [Bacteroidetes bacterium HGW-Bacteroidetes-8]PKP26715.1 MAG: hypothetical protein CVU03_02240 [Bacteroidetes bacterium HGW-Bacteroidetes-2]
MTTRDLKIIDDLITRTNNLPEILHLRAADDGYMLSETDKILLLDTYEKLDDILKEVAAFINVKFPGRQDHMYGWNKIDFDTKIGDFKIITNDREHIKRAWLNGLFDLKSLLKSLKNEVVLLLDNEEQIDKSDMNVRTNNFTGTIIYNESKVTGKQIQSSPRQTENSVTKLPKTTTQIFKDILIGLFVTIIGGIILWFITTILN